MKYLFVFMLLLTGCPGTTQSYYSENYRDTCDKKCLRDYGTNVDWIGELSGKCYCK